MRSSACTHIASIEPCSRFPIVRRWFERTHHVGYVKPGLEVRAHYTPVEEQVYDEEERRGQEDRDHLVVVHETR